METIDCKKILNTLSDATQQRKLLWRYKKTENVYVYKTKIGNYKIIYNKTDSYTYGYPNSETLTIKNTLTGNTTILRNEGKISNLLTKIQTQKDETKEEMIENILEILK